MASFHAARVGLSGPSTRMHAHCVCTHLCVPSLGAPLSLLSTEGFPTTAVSSTGQEPGAPSALHLMSSGALCSLPWPTVEGPQGIVRWSGVPCRPEQLLAFVLPPSSHVWLVLNSPNVPRSRPVCGRLMGVLTVSILA